MEKDSSYACSYLRQFEFFFGSALIGFVKLLSFHRGTPSLLCMSYPLTAFQSLDSIVDNKYIVDSSTILLEATASFILMTKRSDTFRYGV